jgi:hypothetical protein
MGSIRVRRGDNYSFRGTLPVIYLALVLPNRV